MYTLSGLRSANRLAASIPTATATAMVKATTVVKATTAARMAKAQLSSTVRQLNHPAQVSHVSRPWKMVRKMPATLTTVASSSLPASALGPDSTTVTTTVTTSTAMLTATKLRKMMMMMMSSSCDRTCLPSGSLKQYYLCCDVTAQICSDVLGRGVVSPPRHLEESITPACGAALP